MAVILDTDEIIPAHRAGAIKDAMVYASVPCEVTCTCPAGAAWARVASTPFGPTAKILTHQGSGLRMARRARHLRVAAPDRISLVLHGPASGAMTQQDVTRILAAGEMLLIDLTAPYDYWFSAGGSSSFQIDYDDLDLPVYVARAAATRLGGSPLYELVRDHLGQLCRDAEALSLPPAGPAVRQATTQLMRALIVSAADEGTLRRDALAETLLQQVLYYLRAHLADPGLSAEQIASAHGISVRHLQQTWSEMGIELRDWIIAERLEAARRQLARSDPAAGSVADVAHHWGFTDPADFRTRFRAAFGISPAWSGPRDLAQDEGSLPG